MSSFASLGFKLYFSFYYSVLVAAAVVIPYKLCNGNCLLMPFRMNFSFLLILLVI